MKVTPLFVLLAACGDSPTNNPGSDAAVSGDGMLGPDAAPFDPLAGVGAVELVRGGYMFTEGPQWRETQGDLLFSDIPANTIYRYTPGGGAPVVHRMPSGNANGIAIDGAGAVIAAEHGSRSVTRDGTSIASTFEAKPLNSPNDVIVADDGTIYFTDPPYGLPQGTQSAQGFMGVYRLTTGGTLTAEHRGVATSRPNGIGISPDGKTLYVANTDDGDLYTFPIQPDGSLGARTMLVSTTGGADGLAIDIQGNIFVTSTTGIEVFAPSGTKWGTIAVAQKPTNCAFGDADHQTLYITADSSTATSSVYKVRLAHPGLPRR